MKTAKWLVPLTAATFLVAVSARAVVESQLSNTRSASCLVKVTCDPAVLPLDTDTIEDLLRSSSVGGKAAREVLGVPLVDNFLDVDPLSVGSVGEFGMLAKPRGVQKPARGEELYDDESMTMEEYGTLREAEGPEGTATGRSQVSYTPVPSRPTSRPTSPRASSARPRSTYRYVPGPYATLTSSPTSRQTSARITPVGKTPLSSFVAEQELLFRLEVDLREEVIGKSVKPAAEEFMNALVRNLDDALMRAFQDRTSRLKEQIEFTQSQRDKAQAQLSKLMEQAAAVRPSPAIKLDPADQAAYEQLDRIVDLSALSPGIPFAEAIDKLKNSVEPPLKIVVLWRD